MWMSYFDEVKQDPANQPCCWLAAITIPIDVVPELGQDLAALAEQRFATSVLSRDTETHEDRHPLGRSAARRRPRRPAKRSCASLTDR